MMQLHRNAALSTPQPLRRPSFPVEVVRLHPLALKEAHRIVKDAEKRGITMRLDIKGPGLVYVR